MMKEYSSVHKGLIFRAKHRGVKELDIILGGFAEQNLQHLSKEEILHFGSLLDQPENDVMNWVLGTSPVPKKFQTTVLKQIQEFAKGLVKRL